MPPPRKPDIIGADAFTLAEVLITLGIIGIVSTLTIPNLIANHKAVEMRTRLKTAYSLLSQAIEKMKADDISTNPADYGNNKFQPVYIKYFKDAKDCGTAFKRIDKFNCPASATQGYKNYTNTTFPYLSGNSPLDDGLFVLNNGMLIMIENAGPIIFISVDINGFHKPPNRWGYDLFTFHLLDGKLLPMGAEGTAYSDSNYCNNTDKSSINGITCAQKALTEDDYFKKLP